MDSWGKNRDPSYEIVSAETAVRFGHHVERLTPLAEGGNDLARYAIATIHLLGLLYPDEETRASRIERDQAEMTRLLCQCAEGGMIAAFDNLVVSGTGEIGESARNAARDFEQERKPERDYDTGIPVYSPDWMKGAMALWQQRRVPEPRKASRPTEARSDGVFHLLASSVLLALSTLILGMPGDYWPMLLPAFVLSVVGWTKAKIRPLRIVGVFVTGVSGGMLLGDLAAWWA
jgi:hypothetical protein